VSKTGNTDKSHPTASRDQNGQPSNSADSLSEIDTLLSRRSSKERQIAEQASDAKAGRETFLQDFEETLRQVIRPTMEAVLKRLQEDGGDGAIQERGSDASHSPRVILWMSLEGEISADPHQDRNPFLQLDANSTDKQVDVWEGDMWERQGNSKATVPWKLSEISAESLTERIVRILERAAQHGLTGIGDRAGGAQAPVLKPTAIDPNVKGASK